MKKIALVAIVSLIALGSTLSAQTWVNGYSKSNGSYVSGHYRTKPDSNPFNNYSFPGNYNPNKGCTTSGSSSSYLRNYYNRSSGSNRYYYGKIYP